jgi:FAD/FMN-containing dehydrogenase
VTTAATKLTGEVVRPTDPGYDAARIGWNRLYERYPEAIVFCRNAADVVNAVSWARQAGLAFRARSGRHNLEGWSAIDGGLVVDVSRMKGITIDDEAGTATVETGLVQKEAVAALGATGYAIPTGSEGEVGLGGVVLGGGFGLLTRRMGLACDALLAVDIVVADGADSARLIHADADNHADLLWACRGGGGNNFGIATRYTVKLTELTDVSFVYAKWDSREQLGDILRSWQRDAPFADDRLSSALEIDSAGPRALRADVRRHRRRIDRRACAAPADRRTDGHGHRRLVARGVRRRRQGTTRRRQLEVLLPVRQTPVPRRGNQPDLSLHGHRTQPREQLLPVQLRRRGAA